MRRSKYNWHLLCSSSFAYFMAGAILFRKDPYLSMLLLAVTVFSLLHHYHFHNTKLKALDWVLSVIVWLYVYWVFGAQLGSTIFVLMGGLLALKLLDHFVFRAKRYRLFGYTHSAWHVLTAGVILFCIFAKV